MENELFMGKNKREENISNKSGKDIQPNEKKVIENPDLQIKKDEKFSSYKLAEFELLRIKEQLLTSNDSKQVDHRKLASIIQRLMV
ncbi:MAG: hypothetical protein PHV30_02145 [Candidatus Margulisbacteria bacterium]|nr:hypothetical protein [Candidatus Margulisiibacteriota bacterium]